MYKRILIATDGNALSKKAVKSAIELAKVCDAQLTALTVVNPFPGVFVEGAYMLPIEEIDKIELSWLENGRKIVNSVKAAALKQGITVKAITVKSDSVSEAIIAAAKKHKSDLIVMASHGRSGIKRILLGSETQHVLTHSKIPVLVLR